MDQSIREDSRINTLFVPGFAKRRCLLILVNESCRMKARSSICTCPSFGTRSVFCSDGLEAGLVKKALVVAVDRRSFSVAARVAPAEVGTGHWAALRLAGFSGLSGVLLLFQCSLVPDGALYIMTAIMRFRHFGWPLWVFSGEWTLESARESQRTHSPCR
ncbi:hypothetical protein ASPSYDRAFT_241140 [Aspergillus sydowii CBS 593.65]|uniref:Uncharacterized protein n=1 Tax=Aspergillus sydowii CBS 593.65 TaxID=1036612 RepID=A0A1L9TVR6_9EURO|nr:uncharacterized protein ASPSYDRAFT_241140 [Aspergillus sydowii CBS 593.65]OJJ63530.1 hypothetical protein ASPSYDRAFT_241140 [Aspergillus sydowii CBS 593.65]